MTVLENRDKIEIDMVTATENSTVQPSDSGKKAVALSDDVWERAKLQSIRERRTMKALAEIAILQYIDSNNHTNQPQEVNA